jgi:hypothetical protein
LRYTFKLLKITYSIIYMEEATEAPVATEAVEENPADTIKEEVSVQETPVEEPKKPRLNQKDIGGQTLTKKSSQRRQTVRTATRR